MPPPIPPPPAQATAAETRLAVRLVAKVAVAAVALFFAYTQMYRPDSAMMDYGRKSAPTWLLWKAERLDEAKIRAHPGGKVLWLVGSSILRESFDEDLLNEQLAARESPWRVQKFGLSRGAAGLTAGLLERLPLREGDRVLHSVSMDNFHRDWLAFSHIPDSYLMALLDRDDILRTAELSPQRRAELVLATPWRYWAFQEEIATAWWEWLNAPIYGVPKRRTSSRFLTFRDQELHADLEKARALGEASFNHVQEDETDWTDTQFNIAGIQSMRRRCAERGVSFTLVDIPPRQEYVVRFLPPAVRAQWAAWKQAQPDLVYFPQLPEDDFYDLRHPNYRGRASLIGYLLEWLEAPVRGSPAPIHWTPPSAPEETPP